MLSAAVLKSNKGQVFKEHVTKGLNPLFPFCRALRPIAAVHTRLPFLNHFLLSLFHVLGCHSHFPLLLKGTWWILCRWINNMTFHKLRKTDSFSHRSGVLSRIFKLWPFPLKAWVGVHHEEGEDKWLNHRTLKIIYSCHGWRVSVRL